MDGVVAKAEEAGQWRGGKFIEEGAGCQSGRCESSKHK